MSPTTTQTVTEQASEQRLVTGPTYRLLLPLHPKPPMDEDIPGPPRTPTLPQRSLASSAERHLPSSPSIAPEHVEMPDSPSSIAHEPTYLQHAASGNGATTNGGAVWPSQVAQSASTMWLLPPPSDQSSAIAHLLRTEIQSHNITREMLHATEQRRLEAVQRCEKLLADIRSWAAAYNALTAALHKCSQEYSRLSAENVAMSTELQNNSRPVGQLDAVAPKTKQIEGPRRKLFRQTREDSKATPPLNVDVDVNVAPLYVAESELDASPCPYSPELPIASSNEF